ncbi:BamA/TamA family outer membrane protein [Solirubrum puertoriconensis]|uniref:translocation and assembly module lipoprotein TamL n=1 Tax=Solirubrum puertoriconensis TaxID=1751427 RepID=UPI00122E4839|nr:BamA/TamA family outer membrane protein [Solirubrum puertoriconensis]
MMLPWPPRKASWTTLGIVSATLLASCSPMRLLGPRQQLLSEVKLEGVNRTDRDALASLYRQEPNRKFPVPLLAIYNLGYTFYSPERAEARLAATRAKYAALIAEAKTDSVKVGKLLQKRERKVQHQQQVLEQGNAIMRLGQAPVVYDSTLTSVTADQMRIYLRSHGYFRSRVAASDTARNRRVTVTYRIHEGQPFLVSQLRYDIADSAVAKAIRADSSRSLLRVGQAYNEELIGRERSRIESVLKNAGYYDFRQQYVTLEADTSFEPYTVRLLLQVANPPGQQAHRVYSVRKVNFVTDAGLNRFGMQRDTVRRNGVYYLAYNHRFSTRILDRKLSVRPGDRYSLRNTIQTQRQLSGMDVFRFAGVNYQKVEASADSVRFGQLDAVVSTTPMKRFQETTELGGTYVAGLPGPFGNFRVRVRNAFGGAEVLDVGLRAGLEGQYILAQDSLREEVGNQLTTQLGVNINLTLPQFLLPWHSNELFTRYSPRTRLSSAFTYVKRQEYTRTNLEFTYDYIWQHSGYKQFILTPLDISLINTSAFDNTFRRRLERQPNGQALLRSFQSVLVPSANATMLYNTNDFNQTQDARYLRLFAEIGGLGRSLYTRTDELSSGRIGQQNTNIKVYDFVRLSADYRRYHKLTPQQYVVWRLNAGLARALTRTQIRDTITEPFRSAAIIPYDRYMFAGGGSSVRAWLPRRLGVGSYRNPQLVRSESIEQPGELLLEGSLEYRFPIYDYIYGAAFTDFGNVWTLDADPQRPGADFELNRFYKEFAVGSGLGLRLDFTFLIVRLDFAAKVYDPTQPVGSRYVLPKATIFNAASSNNLRLNIGIGYPF